MRIALLTGLVACTIIFALGSEKTSALPLDKLDNVSESTSVDTLLAVATPSDVPETKEIIEDKPPQEVTHAVVKNESLSDIANRHEVTWKKIYDKNVTIENPDVINPGEIIVIPTVDEVVPARELPIIEVVTPVEQPRERQETTTVKTNTSPAPRQVAPRQAARGNSSGNLYTAGNCTWYAKSMRSDMPNNLGNASTWVSRAAAQGMATGSTPQVGAIAQRGNHVAYVTGVNGDGTINISDMNYRNLYEVTYRTVPANQWLFIY